MNLIINAPTVLTGLLALLVLIAAVEDAARMRISNFLPLGIFALAIPAFLLAGPTLAVWENLVVFGALLAAGTLLFATGNFGGGDVKLLAALGLWFDLAGALWLLVYVFIAGGILTVFILCARFFATERPRIAVLKRGSGIPYGIAIAIGGLITIASAKLG